MVETPGVLYVRYLICYPDGLFGINSLLDQIIFSLKLITIKLSELKVCMEFTFACAVVGIAIVLFTTMKNVIHNFCV